MWINYQNGSTIGEGGTENGNIIFDEEHVDGARITLEQNCHQNIPLLSRQEFTGESCIRHLLLIRLKLP